MDTVNHTQKVVIDCHLHLYPCFETGTALTGLVRRLDLLAAAAFPATPVRAALLAERQGEHSFDRLADSQIGPFTITRGNEPGTLLARKEGRPALWLIAGRQINTDERIEMLAPGGNMEIPDGTPAREVIAALRASGLIPALAWAPGKWLFGRGALIRALVAESRPGELLLCDSAIRPRGLPLPSAMRLGLDRGLGIIAGSDPLPFPGDDVWMGTYGIAAQVVFDPERPATSVRNLLAGLRGNQHIAGRRGTLLATIRRLATHHRTRRKGETDC